MKYTICSLISVLFCGKVFSEGFCSALAEMQKRFNMSCTLKEDPEDDVLLSSGKEQVAIEKLFKMECKLVEVCSNAVLSNGTKGCADGWIQFQDSCYLLWSKTALNFTDAAAMCCQNGGRLVFVETEAENNFLKQKLRSLPLAPWWMGITDVEQEGTWKYYGTNKTISFADWIRGTASVERNRNCGLFAQPGWDFKWNDYFCTLPFNTVCEKQIIA